LNSTIFKNSTILSEEKSSDLVKLIGLNVTKNQLLYQASRDGFDPSVFHSKCDKTSATFIVIKSKNSASVRVRMNGEIKVIKTRK
jgi:hypothetical protein